MESDASGDAGGSNRLAQETSLYLRQHMNNPVDWYPWGEEALALARASDKPLLVSIGYSACHWCHVMEHESFEDAQTAELMNALFVCIKVDREERPDVDQLYMDTVVGLQGHGGWPLTVFCTPDGKPFYGGTYYPPEPRHGLPSFRQLLQSIDRVYREERPKVDDTARRILEALRERPQGTATDLPGPELLAGAARRLMQSADRNHGGFGTAPKFPTPTNLDLILAAEPHLAPDEAREALEFLAFSCREMSRRGLYDQLGGGFHRYCVDAHWGVPHFEKMLYDQGQLLRVYADVWRRSGASDDDLVWPITETAEYLRREMRGPEGGWYASQDADSEGEEGIFYAWTPEQVEETLPVDAARRFCQTYAVTPTGNFEGRAVLWDLARGPRDDLQTEREQLYQARSGRVWPATDTKRVASWNALTVSGLAYAGSVLDHPELIADARAGADFLRSQLRGADGRWLRVWAGGKARIPAFLDDLSALLTAFLDLHRAGAGDEWLPLALEVAEDLVEHFFDPQENDLFLSPADAAPLAQRPRSDHDGATPHSCGLAVSGLLRAASLSGNEALRETAERVIRTHAFALERSPLAYPTLLRAAVWLRADPGLALIVGDPEAAESRALALRARQVLAPEDAVLVTAPGSRPPGVDTSWLAERGLLEGRPAAYVCRGVSCSLPVSEPEKLVAGR